MNTQGKSIWIGMLISVFILLQGTSGYTGTVRGVTDTTIKVGTIGDLTGPVAGVWVPAAGSLKDYFNYVKEMGGIHGRSILNVMEDDRYSIPLALSSFKKLVFKDRVLLIFGASGVGHTHSIIPLAQKNNVPMIAATNDRKFFDPVIRQVFTPLPFYEDQIKLIFEYIFKDMNAKNPTIALAYPDTAAGNISRDTCREAAKRYKVKNFIEVVISAGAGDFTSQILALKRSKPDYVIIHGYIGSTSALLRDAYKFRLKSNFIAIQYACVDDTIKIAGVAAKGLIGTNCFSSWNDASPGIERMRKVVMKYHPATKWMNRNYVNGWFASMLIHKGLENAGRDLTPEAFIKGLEEIQNFDTKGICGIISFGPDDHKSIEYSRFYKVDLEKNRFVPITGWRKPATED